MASKFILLLLLRLLILTQLYLVSSSSSLPTKGAPLTYHNGTLLQGNIPISILWYGNFTPTQKSILTDFLLFLTPTRGQLQPAPSLSQWWKTIDVDYLHRANKTLTSATILIGNQLSDEKCSLSKLLTRRQIHTLARKIRPSTDGIALVLTSADVAVEKFCMSSCGIHGSSPGSKPAVQFTCIWVGNPATQCPGQCAWPFHQQPFGPQSPPLIAPNGDVGVDGMVINVATLLAGTVTNPFGDGFYQGNKMSPLEAASACAGIYGKGAYPGYPGDLLVDPTTKASYNAHGSRGRKYLVPALFDPSASTCITTV